MKKNNRRVDEEGGLTEYKNEEESSSNDIVTFVGLLMSGALFLLFCIMAYGLDIHTFVILIIYVVFFFAFVGIEYKKVSYKSRVAKDKLNIEGMVDDREFANLDLNSDGYIDLSEYYTKTEDEVISLIKEKCPHFVKDEFYDYVRKSILTIEEGLSKDDYEVFSGYLNYSYYKQLKNKIRINRAKKESFHKIIGVILKDCVLVGDIMTVKVAITLSYRGRDKNDIYILTYINNLKDSSLDSSKCINCGSTLNKGICDYCDTYNYLAYEGFILSDKTSIRISWD